MKTTITIAGLSIITLTACASTPDVTVSYFQPKAESRAQVTQTIACDEGKQVLLVANSGAVTTTYAADPTRKEAFRIAALSGDWANSDATFSFTDDGRLKGVNTSSTGKGEELVTAAIKVVGIVLAAAAPVAPEPACDVVARYGGGKPVSLTYAAPVPHVAQTTPLKPDAASVPLYEALKSKLPTLEVVVDPPEAVPSRASYDKTIDTRSAAALKLVRHNRYPAKLTAKDATRPASAPETVWSGSILSPVAETYDLPIPRAAFFGKQTFALSLSEAGSITSIGYGTETGAVAAMNSASSLGSALQGDSVAVQAAGVQAQADLIAQQQRLMRCQSKPDTCE